MAAGVKCGQLDISKVSEDDLLVNEAKDSVWIRSDVDEKIYVIPNDKNPYVVIKFSEGCFVHVCEPDLTKINKSFLLYGAAIETVANTGVEQNPVGGSNPSGTIPAPSGNEEDDNTIATICGVDTALLEKAQNRVDGHAINEKGFQPAAVIPAEAIIPMKSNIFTYGPYVSSNFMTSFGGTQAETNTDLCPWVFGSSQLMNEAAQLLVDKSVIGLVKSETGSVTVTGLPNIPTLGTAISAGPTLTGINTTFGSSGITTSYEFRTYTPKLGGLSRPYIDRIKRIAKNRQDNIRLLRANNINQIKINRKIRVAANRAAKADAEIAKPKNQKNSLARIIIGEMTEFGALTQGSGARTVVGIETLSKSVLEMRYDYKQKAFMSLDGLFGPVSINGGYSNTLPQYITPYSGSDIKHLSSPLHAQPPFATGKCPVPDTPHFQEHNNLRINNWYLNPLANPSSIPHYNKDSSNGSGHPGHSIDLVGREDEVPESGLITNFRLNKDPLKYSDDYRFLGMRGPIILHSWGYDIDGKPIPNHIDTENDAKQGVFKTTKTEGNQIKGLKDEFMEDWLQKPGTWPVGPVDLRFDRERGVWVSPQPFRIVVARVIKPVPKCGAGVGLLLNMDDSGSTRYGRKLFTKDGDEVEENDLCLSDGNLCYGNSEPNESCAVWVLINVSPCPQTTPSPTSSCDCPGPCSYSENNLNISLALQGNSLVLTYTHCGQTKTASVPTTNCGGSSSSSVNVEPSSSSSSIPNISSSSSSSSSDSSSSSSSSNSSSSSEIQISGSDEEIPIIKLVDRIGVSHKIGDMVYAYYDTFTHQYIILESNADKSRTSSEIAYGYVTGETMNILGGTSPDLIQSDISIINPLGLDINCDQSQYGVASKVYVC
jgi:hypothetical protein